MPREPLQSSSFGLLRRFITIFSYEPQVLPCTTPLKHTRGKCSIPQGVSAPLPFCNCPIYQPYCCILAYPLVGADQTPFIPLQVTVKTVRAHNRWLSRACLWSDSQTTLGATSCSREYVPETKIYFDQQQVRRHSFCDRQWAASHWPMVCGRLCHCELAQSTRNQEGLEKQRAKGQDDCYYMGMANKGRSS